MNRAFNENFYIVTATINPIFFLALTLQGSFYGRLMERVNNAVKALVKAGKEKNTTWKTVVLAYIGIGVAGFAMAILIAGFGGEFLALHALYNQSGSNHIQALVFWSTAGMIFITAAIPGWTVMHAYSLMTVVSQKNLLVSLKDLVRMKVNQAKDSDNAEANEDGNPHAPGASSQATEQLSE